jgi:hypothetical protein
LRRGDWVADRLPRPGNRFASARVRSAFGEWTLIVMVAVCSGCGSDDTEQARTLVWRATDSGPLGSVDSSLTPPCAGTRDDSDPIPFSVLDLGPKSREEIAYPGKPEGRAVVRTPDEWTRVWHALADSSSVPPVDLRDAVILIAATREYTHGPKRLKFESVRRCRTSGDIITTLRVHTNDAANDYGARSLTAIRIAKSEVNGRAIFFLDLPWTLAR